MLFRKWSQQLHLCFLFLVEGEEEGEFKIEIYTEGLK